MRPFPFDAVLFDCDGVLVDSEPLTNRVLAEMLSEQGWALTTEEASRIFTGKSVLDEAAQIESRTGVAVTTAWLQAFRARRNEVLMRELVEIPGAPAAVRAVHAAAGGRIACASGADRHKVGLQLAKVGLLDVFQDRYFSGQDMPRSKPAPDVYLAAAAALGVDPTRCAVVEDTVTGIAAGVAAGATVFGYSPETPWHGNSASLMAAGAARVFSHMDQLPILLAGYRHP